MELAVKDAEPIAELDGAEVESLIPHRGDILFVRKATILADDRFRSVVAWGADAMGMGGHFPQAPIVPAVYMIEAVAQLAGIGMRYVEKRKRPTSSPALGVLAAVQRCAFKQVLLPDQDLLIGVHARVVGEQFARVRASLERSGEVVAEVELLLANMSSSVLPVELGAP
jgi:3-hydroxyacyl-[acyl-carrier-protein] dehydratase